MTSDGQLTAQGLMPQRYDEQTEGWLAKKRVVSMRFTPTEVELANGERRERWPDVQDTASQFVQLTWLFMTQPERLHPGGSVEMGLALPRSMDRWVFDVLEEEQVTTPFGPVPAFHLKPRRVSRPGGDWIIEIWFAPRLRYLPARIRIVQGQDPDTYLDLVLSKKPEMAGP